MDSPLPSIPSAANPVSVLESAVQANIVVAMVDLGI